MGTIEIHKRTSSNALAASSEELDALATAFAELVGSATPARWRIAHPDFNGIEVEGSLGELAETIDLARVTSFTLRVGGYNSARRLTLDGGRFTVSADVWGDSAEWVHDAVALVDRRLKVLRGWWWAAKTGWAATAYTLMVASIALVVLAINGTPLSSLAAGVGLGLSCALVGGLTAITAIPSFRLGARKTGKSVWRTVLLGTLYVLAGAVAGVAVSALFGSFFG